MNRPDPNAEDAALREVQAAYRDLPAVGPNTDLDARVRAAVAAEIAAGSDAASAPRPREIRSSRWRRTALPFAAAAAVLVAIGVHQLQRDPAEEFEAAFKATQTAPEAARERYYAGPPTAAPGHSLERPRSQLPQPPPPARYAPRPPPPSYVPPAANTPLLDLPVVAGPPAVAKAPATPQTGELAGLRAESARNVASGSASDAAPATARASSPPAGLARAAPTLTVAEDAAAFDEVRQLLAQKKREEAIARLKRWRETHATAVLPDDLKALETASGQ